VFSSLQDFIQHLDATFEAFMAVKIFILPQHYTSSQHGRPRLETKILQAFLISPMYDKCLACFILLLFHCPIAIWWKVHFIKFLVLQLSAVSYYFQIFALEHCSQTP